LTDLKGICQLIEGIGWATILVGIYGSEHNPCVPFRNIDNELGLKSTEGRKTQEEGVLESYLA
jgi:hypothetical protein